ncbi:MAG: hypothetical protein EBR85_01835 [Betaproteobacteria bacterium]|nr:hypothetical protein [Betaproteobacteria bacterium]
MTELSKEALTVLELMPSWRQRTVRRDPAAEALAQRVHKICKELQFSAPMVDQVLDTGPALSACMEGSQAKRDLWARLCRARRTMKQR